VSEAHSVDSGTEIKSWEAFGELWKIVQEGRKDGGSTLLRNGLTPLENRELMTTTDTLDAVHLVWEDLSRLFLDPPTPPNQDVITEVYDSWFKAFEVIRDLAKSVPAHRIKRSENTRKLVEHMIDVLNRYSLGPCRGRRRAAKTARV
jgi:hypothetical protein